jgi:1-acyl-sn-glycerol-3-phosphate acyltransferase
MENYNSPKGTPDSGYGINSPKGLSVISKRNYNKVFSVNIYSYYYWFQRILAWIIYRGIFGCVIEGRENIDFRRSFLILSNHCSHMDPPLVGFAVPKPIAYMTRSDLFKIPLLNKLMHISGAFSINRDGNDNSFIENTVNALESGWLVTIFPEGSRSADGRFSRVKTGAARILLAHPLPFLPVAVINTHKAWPKKTFKINPFVRIKVKIGKTVYPEEYLPAGNLSEAEKIKHISDLYAERIYELLPPDQK